MEETILITYLNDFIFCPLSIYYHHLYGNTKSDLYNTTKQVDGLISHESIDNAKYSSDSSVLQGIDVYSSRFNLMGKNGTLCGACPCTVRSSRRRRCRRRRPCRP